MGIPHSHRNGGVCEDLLKDQDIATIHREVTGEGVTQYTLWIASGTVAPEAGQTSPELEHIKSSDSGAVNAG